MAQSSVDSSLNVFKRFSEEGMARLISDLGNPLFMPPIVVGFCCLLLGQSLKISALLLAISVVCYTVLPLALTLYLFKHGLIDSMDLPIRETRTSLYAFSIASAVVASLFIYLLIPAAHPFLLLLSFVFLINLGIAFMLNLKWKISVHSASVAVAGTVYGVLYFLGISEFATLTIILSLLHLLVLLPIMVWGRYHLKAHSTGELIGGSSSGIFLTILEIITFQYLW
ncbi:MAG: hypothetical protein U5J63_15450 [Fodinibius sp.]|nr:hypothetical protein [Fodinibius sp.]